jgi:hypothetical protein
MVTKIIKTFRNLLRLPNLLWEFRREFQCFAADAQKNLACAAKDSRNLLFLNARLLNEGNKTKREAILKDITLSEYRVFSQFGDDGIIQFLVDYLEIETKTFIEFGVQIYEECNTRFLLENNNWRGLVIDSSEEYMTRLKQEEVYWRCDLKAVSAFVDKDNINSLISENRMDGEIGLLHIDIDGNDYHVWKAITVVSPVIAIVEYNSVFGSDNAWTVPYDPKFHRTQRHHSNLFFGASLLSLCDLAKEKKYSFIGCNSAGNNAYFVRNDKLRNLCVKTPKEGYVCSAFRESRNCAGEFTYVSGTDRMGLLKGLEVWNTRTGNTEIIP